mmetsp:Transcript_13858/g.42959  ORF Transcript_13858/g.42959 Transcript_13858/m.42959 type:complete len:273 (+) Transcript_13858:492-1310(+)
MPQPQPSSRALVAGLADQSVATRRASAAAAGQATWPVISAVESASPSACTKYEMLRPGASSRSRRVVAAAASNMYARHGSSSSLASSAITYFFAFAAFASCSRCHACNLSCSSTSFIATGSPVTSFSFNCTSLVWREFFKTCWKRSPGSSTPVALPCSSHRSTSAFVASSSATVSGIRARRSTIHARCGVVCVQRRANSQRCAQREPKAQLDRRRPSAAARRSRLDGRDGVARLLRLALPHEPALKAVDGRQRAQSRRRAARRAARGHSRGC